jgi:hypothetical protein
MQLIFSKRERDILYGRERDILYGTERKSFTASDSLAPARSYIVSPEGKELTQASLGVLGTYIGQQAGAAVGAKVGVALGTVILPGTGTVAGGILGFVVAKKVIKFIEEL